MAPQWSPVCRATWWWRGRKDWTGQGTTVALGPTSAARRIGPSTVHHSMPAGRWGRTGALPASHSSRLCAHANHLRNAEADGTIGRFRTSFARALKAHRAHVRPNMRLKLAGLSLLKESEWLCPGGHTTVVHFTCAGGLVAGSLSAIR